jgi:pyridoxal phosphate enzyme (YggS family)
MSIESNLHDIKSKLGTKCNLIAVSKMKPISMILEAIQGSQEHFGENKVQDLCDKANELKDQNIKWHFIGHLQSNKINQLLKCPNLLSIHSIDSIKLLDKLLSKKIDKVIELFIQINTSDEFEKGGFEADFDFTQLISRINEHESFKLKGFMTIGKIRTDDFEKDAKVSFEILNNLKSKYGEHLDLSMGMSSDYKIALEYNTNWIRVGSAIFGQR